MASFEQVVKFPLGMPRGEGGTNPLGEPRRLAEDGSPYLVGLPRLGSDVFSGCSRCAVAIYNLVVAYAEI